MHVIRYQNKLLKIAQYAFVLLTKLFRAIIGLIKTYSVYKSIIFVAKRNIIIIPNNTKELAVRKTQYFLYLLDAIV